MSHTALRRRLTLRFCGPCNRRDAAHLDGRCTMTAYHRTATCVCGRHAPTGICSECEARAAAVAAEIVPSRRSCEAPTPHGIQEPDRGDIPTGHPPAGDVTR